VRRRRARARAVVKHWLLALGAAECPKLPVVTVFWTCKAGKAHGSCPKDALPPGSWAPYLFNVCLSRSEKGSTLAGCTMFETNELLRFSCLENACSGSRAVLIAKHLVLLLGAALRSASAADAANFLHCATTGRPMELSGLAGQPVRALPHASLLLDQLKKQAWLPTGGALAAPADAFLLTDELRGALGEEASSLPLVDSAVGLTPELARAIGVNCTFDADVALLQLRRAAAQPATAAVNPSALQRCYRVLGARCAADEAYAATAQAALRDRQLIRVDDGTWASTRDCAWAHASSCALPGMHSLERLYGSVSGLSAALFAALGVPQRAPVAAYLQLWAATGGAALSDAAMTTIYGQVNDAAIRGELSGDGPHTALKAKLLAGALRIASTAGGDDDDDDSSASSGPVVINDDAPLCALLRAHGCGVRAVWVPPGEHWTQHSALLCTFLQLPRVTQYVTRQPAAVLLPPGAAAHAADAPFLTGDVKTALCGLLYNSQRGERGAWCAAREGGALRAVLRTRDVLCAALSVRYALRDGRAFTCEERAAWVGRTLWRVARLRPAGAAAAARERTLAAVAAALAPQDATLSDALRLLAGHLVMAAQHEPETAAALLAQHAPRWDADDEGAAACAWVTEHLQPNHTALLAPLAADEDEEKPAPPLQPSAVAGQDAGQDAGGASAAVPGAPPSEATAADDGGDDGAMDQADDDHGGGGYMTSAPLGAPLGAVPAPAHELSAGVTNAFTAAVNTWVAHQYGQHAVTAAAGGSAAAGPARAAAAAAPPPSAQDEADAAPASAAETAAANAAVTAALRAASAAASAQAAAAEGALLTALLASQRRCALSRVDVPAALAAVRLDDDADAGGAAYSSASSSTSPPLALLLRADLAALFRARMLTLTPMPGHGLKVHVAPALLRSVADGAQPYRELHGSIKPVEDAVLADAPLCAALQRSHAAAASRPPKREEGAAAPANGAGVKREHDAAQHVASPRGKRPKREAAECICIDSD
jgi:hypothetical protein